MLMIFLSSSAAVTGGTLVFLTVTAGEEVTLPSDHVKEDQQSCNASTWLHSRKEAAVELFNLGKIKTNTDKADRLSLTANCSLVIGNVEVKDRGHYTYRQFDRAGEQHGPDVQVQLSVHKSEYQHQKHDTHHIPVLKLMFLHRVSGGMEVSDDLCFVISYPLQLKEPRRRGRTRHRLQTVTILVNINKENVHF